MIVAQEEKYVGEWNTENRNFHVCKESDSYAVGNNHIKIIASADTSEEIHSQIRILEETGNYCRYGKNLKKFKGQKCNVIEDNNGSSLVNDATYPAIYRVNGDDVLCITNDRTNLNIWTRRYEEYPFRVVASIPVIHNPGFVHPTLKAIIDTIEGLEIYLDIEGDMIISTYTSYLSKDAIELASTLVCKIPTCGHIDNVGHSCIRPYFLFGNRGNKWLGGCVEHYGDYYSDDLSSYLGNLQGCLTTLVAVNRKNWHDYKSFTLQFKTFLDKLKEVNDVDSILKHSDDSLLEDFPKDRLPALMEMFPNAKDLFKSPLHLLHWLASGEWEIHRKDFASVCYEHSWDK